MPRKARLTSAVAYGPTAPDALAAVRSFLASHDEDPNEGWDYHIEPWARTMLSERITVWRCEASTS